MKIKEEKTGWAFVESGKICKQDGEVDDKLNGVMVLSEFEHHMNKLAEFGDGYSRKMSDADFYTCLREIENFTGIKARRVRVKTTIEFLKVE